MDYLRDNKVHSSILRKLCIQRHKWKQQEMANCLNSAKNRQCLIQKE